MRFFHLSDLHLGKRVNDFPMIEDQSYILNQIIEKTSKYNPDGIIIAGDIYDKSSPSREAILLFDDFLTKLSEKNLKVFAISGNHDGAEKIAYGSNLLKKSQVYMSPIYDGTVTKATLKDKFGVINIYLLPFVKPQIVNQLILNNDIETESDHVNSFNEAIKAILDTITVDKSQRNVLVSHQFITNAERTDSEDIYIGGAENVDSTLFDDFDYVALGHLHKPQKVCREEIRYCGSPLKYSFSEFNHKKSITMVDINEKGNICISLIPLTPQKDMREIKGTFKELTSSDFISKQNVNDYLHITLTDDDDIENALNKLRTEYPNIMKLDYDNKRTSINSKIEINADFEEKTPLEMFESLYLMQNNISLNSEQETLLDDLIDKVWGNNIETD